MMLDSQTLRINCYAAVKKSMTSLHPSPLEKQSNLFVGRKIYHRNALEYFTKRLKGARRTRTGF